MKQLALITDALLPLNPASDTTGSRPALLRDLDFILDIKWQPSIIMLVFCTKVSTNVIENKHRNV